MTTRSNTAEAISFLSSLRSEGPHHLVAIRERSKHLEAKTFTADDLPAAAT